MGCRYLLRLLARGTCKPSWEGENPAFTVFHAYVLNSIKNYQAFKKQTGENKIIEIDPSQINKNEYFFLKKGLFGGLVVRTLLLPQRAWV